MNSKKITSYLLYAVGEIILVVIGILIAVNINNWNENRKTEVNLRAGLLSLKNDLVQDTLLIAQKMPLIINQFVLNESLRDRIARPGSTVDTLVKIARREFVPNWTEPLVYNMNAYNSLSSSGMLDQLEDSLGYEIKAFYNQKAINLKTAERIAEGYRTKIATYLDTYAFGSTDMHDQGELIDSLIWTNVDYAHLAASFQGLSNYKRILFRDTKEEMEFSMQASKALIDKIDYYLTER